MVEKKPFMEAKLRFVTIALLIPILFTHAQDWQSFSYPLPQSEFGDYAYSATVNPTVDFRTYTGFFKGVESGLDYQLLMFYYLQSDQDSRGFQIVLLEDDRGNTLVKKTIDLNRPEEGTNDSETKAFFNLEQHWGSASLKELPDDFKAYIPEYDTGSVDGAATTEIFPADLLTPLGDTLNLTSGVEKVPYSYSLEKSKLTGLVRSSVESEDTKGTMWTEKQGTNMKQEGKLPFELFFISLDNGMQFSIMHMYDCDNQSPDILTFNRLSYELDEDTRGITGNFTIDRGQFAFVKEDEAFVPEKWTLFADEPGLELEIKLEKKHLRLESEFDLYLGSITVEGIVEGQEVHGNGFLELTKNYKKPEVELVLPPMEAWDGNIPVALELKNPDEGLALYYDIHFKSARNQRFLPILEKSQSPDFHWNHTPNEESTTYQFRVFAYNQDSSIAISFDTIISREIEIPTEDFSDNYPERLQIYPNPASTFIKMNMDAPMSNIDYNILDVKGQLVQSGEFSSINQEVNLPLNSKAPGTYVIYFKDQEGRLISGVFIVR